MHGTYGTDETGETYGTGGTGGGLARRGSVEWYTRYSKNGGMLGGIRWGLARL